MTKEEAIEWLKSLNYCDGEETQEVAQAIEMGIKALEQQPSDDCVSRQKVKEGMKKYGFHAPDMTVTEFIEDELPPVIPKVPTSGDCVSRKDLLAQINESWETIETKLDFVNIVKASPSVKPKVSTSDDCVSRAEVIRLAEQGQIQGFVWQIQKLITMSPVTPKVPTFDDCVSRQAVLKLLESYVDEESLNDGLNDICYEFVSEKIKKLPPVTPTLPKDATNMEKLEKIEKIVNSYDGSAVSVIKQFIEIQKVLEKE